MLDYHDAYSNDELSVTFEDCSFRVRTNVSLGMQKRLYSRFLTLSPTSDRKIDTLVLALKLPSW